MNEEDNANKTKKKKLENYKEGCWGEEKLVKVAGLEAGTLLHTNKERKGCEDY